MPLIAEYSWKEKESHIKVSIPTKGVSSSKIDIFGNVADLDELMLFLMTFFLLQ
jgi:hypothetical protein